MLSRRSPTLRKTLRITLTAGALAGAAALAFTTRGAHAEDAAGDQAEQNERCAIRLSIALVGKSPDAQLMSSTSPQGAVDAMLASPEFADRFASFLNTKFNGAATTATEDTVYAMTKYVITNDKPWSDMFVGPYKVVPTATGMDVQADPNGLGYFRSPTWMKRYAGNESAGYMLSASFRILSNTTGLVLTPSVGLPDDDRTETGRLQSPCKSCHFDQWYALDKVARLLPLRKGQGDLMTFTPPTEGPQQVAGKTLANDKELVNALVSSDAFRFAQCRNVFEFLYGRPENQCEAPLFDKCVDALDQQKTIKAAVAAVAKDPSFCSN